MAQHDMNIANQGFPAFRSDLNNALSAIQTNHSGTSRPTGAVAGQIWLDTTNATNPTLKFFDGTDDISLATIDYSANTVNWLDSTVSADLVGDTTPQLGGQLDVNGFSIGDGTLELLKFSETASAVNELTVTNSATGNAPELSSTGDDTNIDIKITPKGSGNVVLDGLKYPNADGTTGQFLKTDGSGNLSFDTVSTAGTVLTTQGDILYRDGSGLQRLGAGTNGQVLTTGGAGANPSWSTVSSDFVKIAETTATGTGAQVYLEYDMSAYKNVILKYRNLYTTATNSTIGLRVGYGSTPSYLATNTYRQLARGMYFDFGSNAGTAGAGYLYDWIMMNAAWSQYGSSDNAGFGELEIFDINSTNGLQKPFTFLNGFRENNYRIYLNQGGWLEDSNITSGAITGFEISAGGNNIYGEFTLYGVK